MNRLLKAAKDPNLALSAMLMNKKAFRLLPDKLFLKWVFRLTIGKRLNLKDPQSFNEKLQWLKLYNRNESYTQMVDKYLAKQYIADKLGEKYVIPTIGVWDSVDDIDFDALPNAFVLKCTHDSGGVIVCKDKSKLDISLTKDKLEKSMQRKYFYGGREWPYKNVKPRIIAEELIEDISDDGLVEYKIFCFDGKAKMVDICKGKAHSNERTNDFCDINTLQRFPFETLLPNSKGDLTKPNGYGEMVEAAEVLSEGIPHVRVDFYNVEGKIYVGEMTFFHNSGFCKIVPEEWDYKLGEWIELPKRKENE